jgi:hypothetical protein
MLQKVRISFVFSGALAILGLIPFYGLPYAMITLLIGLLKTRKKKTREAVGLLVCGAIGTLVSGYILLFIPYDGASQPLLSF